MASKKDATIARAHEYAAAGQFAKAVATWRELLDGSPTDANVYNTIGDLCLKNRMTADAVEAYSKAARFFLQEGFHLKAIALYKKILKLSPDRADLCTMLGDLNVVRGLMNNAIADYLAGAKVYIQKGHNTNALTLFRKIMKVDPRNMDIRLRVAELCRKEKLTEGAIAEYTAGGLVVDVVEEGVRNRLPRDRQLPITDLNTDILRRRREVGLFRGGGPGGGDSRACGRSPDGADRSV